MKKIAIIGAGGFGREVKMLIDHINQKESQFKLIGFFDDKEHNDYINGVPYLGKVSNVNDIEYTLAVAVAIADPK